MIELAAVDPAPVIATPPLFDAVSITLGALSGALYARRKNFDIIGILAISIATGLGGGVIRDLLLVSGTPAFLTTPTYLLYAVAGGIVGVFFARWAVGYTFVFNAIDVATLGVWVLLGCQKAALIGMPPIGVVFVGVVASVGGGLLRDLLCGEVPAALRPGQWFAFASFVAAITYVMLNELSTPLFVDEVLTLVVAALFRWWSTKSSFTPPMPMDISETTMTWIKNRWSRNHRPAADSPTVASNS